MTRILPVFIALVAGLVGGIAVQWLMPAPAPVSANNADIRAVVEQVLAQQPPTEAPAMNVAEIDPDTLNPMIENYLMGDPKVLQRVSDALQDQLRRDDIEQARVSLAAFDDELYADPDHVVLGNPDGDVTLVEFFDYNCTYCRAAMPDIARLLEEDPNLRIILKEFPILSSESMDAARIAVAVSQVPDADYWTFHENLFTVRGQVDADAALDAAAGIGLNPVTVELAASDENVAQIIQRSYTMAQGLNITGTPTFIIGDEILPGAVGYEALKLRVDNMRDCGSTLCDG